MLKERHAVRSKAILNATIHTTKGTSPSAGVVRDILRRSEAGLKQLPAYHTGDTIAIHIAGCAVVRLVSAPFMPNYTGEDISAEYVETAA
jgi:hypothetical protein